MTSGGPNKIKPPFLPADLHPFEIPTLQRKKTPDRFVREPAPAVPVAYSVPLGGKSGTSGREFAVRMAKAAVMTHPVPMSISLLTGCAESDPLTQQRREVPTAPVTTPVDPTKPVEITPTNWTNIASTPVDRVYSNYSDETAYTALACKPGENAAGCVSAGFTRSAQEQLQNGFLTLQTPSGEPQNSTFSHRGLETQIQAVVWDDRGYFYAGGYSGNDAVVYQIQAGERMNQLNTWQLPPNTGNKRIESMAIGANKIYLAGHVAYENGHSSPWLEQLDMNGNPIPGSEELLFAGLNRGKIEKIILAKDGGVLVAGYTGTNAARRLFVAKAKEGEEGWIFIAPDGLGTTTGTAILENDEGDIIIGGQKEEGETSNGILLKLNSAGNLLGTQLAVAAVNGESVRASKVTDIVSHEGVYYVSGSYRLNNGTASTPMIASFDDGATRLNPNTLYPFSSQPEDFAAGSAAARPSQVSALSISQSGNETFLNGAGFTNTPYAAFRVNFPLR